MRIGINGLGRTGRAELRQALRRADVDVVAVNDPLDNLVLATMVEYDTVHGRLGTAVDVIDGALVIGDTKIRLYGEREPRAVPWAEHGVDVVLESSGHFNTGPAAAGHLEAGARAVVIGAPAKDVDLTVCMGVNDAALEPARHRIVSNASCTTNCAAPMAKLVHDRWGVERGFLMTVHAYTNDQRILDFPHEDPRRARAAAQNIIPTSTGAAKALGLVVPELAGKIEGLALRVPVPDGSITELVLELGGDTSAGDVNAAFREASAGPLRAIVGYTEDPIVSSDVIGDTHSCLLDAALTAVNGRTLRLLGWYDNEWAYAARMLDVARLFAS